MERRPSWHYIQSAVVPFRRQGDGLEVLLITSRKGTHWVLPKGIVEPGMTAADSAAKEAWEEAGIEGNVIAQSLGWYSYDKWHGTCAVEVFPMEVTTELTDWPEAETRRREWLSLNQAAERLDHEHLRAILGSLPDALDSGV